MTRSTVAALILALIGTGCAQRPGFIPSTKHLYAAFTPLPQPRAEVPVGALWVDGYGPVGAGAAADNLVTERSLSGFTYDSDFQASLTLGLLKFLDLDPSLRSKVTVRFGDLAIIRIKDWSKLDGPAGQPRLYEALRAGTISVTTVSSVGLDIENRAVSQHLPIFGRGTTGSARTFTIDGKDLFFSVHVAQLVPVTRHPTRVLVRTGHPAVAQVGGDRIELSAIATGKCARAARVAFQPLAQTGAEAQQLVDVSGKELILPLEMPRSPSADTLLTNLTVRAHRDGHHSCDHVTVDLDLRGQQLRKLDARWPG